MADIFISYSKTRGVEAAELAGELGDLGYNVWWDTGSCPPDRSAPPSTVS